MDNNTILNDRWKYTDKKLQEYLKIYKKISSRTQDSIQDIFNSINYSYLDLNKPISTAQRKKLLRVIEEWEELGLLTGYFKYKVEELIIKRYITNEEMLDILLWGTYVKERSQLDEYEKKLFIDVGNNFYQQGIDEIKPDKSKKWSLTWEYVWSLLTLPNIKGDKWTTYIEAIALTYSQEIKRQAILHLQQKKKLDINNDVFQNVIRKQNNKYLSINDDKYSGAFDSQVVEIANQSLLKAGEDVGDKKLQVRFIAEMDARTTEMCESMNNMLFYVNDWNKFYRYSADDGKNVYYAVKGLVSGINLPPINNHFHYCRSTITYLIDMPREQLNKNLMTNNEKSAIQQWESYDFYDINRKMYKGMKLTKDEKRKVKDLYRALNKVPFYEAKEDQYIVRTLVIDNEADIQKIIEQHPINKVYKSLSYEAYSIKDGYHDDPNVYFYIQGSKKARNMLKYNSGDGNIEVLYQYGRKFITLDYQKIDGKHYFLLEEYDD